jgi:hypothetical protein
MKSKRRYNEEKKHVYYTIGYSKVLHREDGPALISDDGNIEWWFNGKLHREDGPAVIYWHGFKEWYLNGRYFSTKERWFDALSEEQKRKAVYSEYFIRG